MKIEFEFCFRVWVHPEDGDPADIEVWFQGLEPTESGKRHASDWARESLSNEDFHDLFDLDKDKHWQVVGKGTLCGWHDYFGEYDEELDIVEFESAEVLEESQPQQGNQLPWPDEGDGMKNAIEVLAIGSRVTIGKMISATVIGVSITASNTSYHVAYWNGNEYKRVWLEGFELEAGDEVVKRKIGFIGGSMHV